MPTILIAAIGVVLILLAAGALAVAVTIASGRSSREYTDGYRDGRRDGLDTGYARGLHDGGSTEAQIFQFPSRRRDT
jgi:hypothetical protein